MRKLDQILQKKVKKEKEVKRNRILLQKRYRTLLTTLNHYRSLIFPFNYCPHSKDEGR